MRLSLSIWSLLLCLFVGSAVAQNRPLNFTVNVDPEDASGRILVNGVPIKSFGGGAGGLPGMGLAIGTGMWLVEGENSIVVEAVPAGAKPVTRVVILRTIAEPPVFEATIEGAGKAEHKVTVDKVHRWGWLDADKWQGNNEDVLAAVRRLHAAYAAKDQARIIATRAALDADFDAVMGPASADEIEQEKKFLEVATLDPMASDLAVTTYYDGRLVAVSRSDGTAPILLASPNVPGKSEIARFWVKKGGTWLVVR